MRSAFIIIYPPAFDNIPGILQADKPDDYVIATGESHTVREFVECAFCDAGIDIEWDGSGQDEKGIAVSVSGTAARHVQKGNELIRIDPRYFRPAEVDRLVGDPSKARKVLGWEPKVRFRELVTMMVKADLEEQRKQVYLKDGGFMIKDYHE